MSVFYIFLLSALAWLSSNLVYHTHSFTKLLQTLNWLKQVTVFVITKDPIYEKLFQSHTLLQYLLAYLFIYKTKVNLISNWFLNIEIKYPKKS